MTPFQASKQSNEKIVSSNLQDRRFRQQPRYKLGDLVRTSDIRSVFRKGGCTNYSYEVYTITQIIRYTIPCYRRNYLSER